MPEVIKKRKKKRKQWNRSKPRYWTKGRCREVAKRCKTLSEFKIKYRGAYASAAKNGWLEEYTWLELKWSIRTDESVMERARKYVSRFEFYKEDESAWRYALKHDLLDKMDWFIDTSSDEFKQWMYGMRGKIYNLLISLGVSATREWLFIESGKEDVYSEDQRKLLKRWSEKVTENWATFKKHVWWNYPDMDYRKGNTPGDDSLHIKP